MVSEVYSIYIHFEDISILQYRQLKSRRLEIFDLSAEVPRDLKYPVNSTTV